jgi:hypothetical protein
MIPFLIVGHLLKPFLDSWIVGQDIGFFESLLEDGRRCVLLQNIVVGRETSHFGEVATTAGNHFGQLELKDLKIQT